eukprot:3956664-Pyramimonas_sp.AAC.1
MGTILHSLARALTARSDTTLQTAKPLVAKMRPGLRGPSSDRPDICRCGSLASKGARGLHSPS